VAVRRIVPAQVAAVCSRVDQELGVDLAPAESSVGQAFRPSVSHSVVCPEPVSTVDCRDVQHRRPAPVLVPRVARMELALLSGLVNQELRRRQAGRRRLQNEKNQD
jgi:hypothetical protein